MKDVDRSARSLAGVLTWYMDRVLELNDDLDAYREFLAVSIWSSRRRR